VVWKRVFAAFGNEAEQIRAARFQQFLRVHRLAYPVATGKNAGDNAA
jgi:hypothetical protein